MIVTPTNKRILIDGGGNENYDVGKNTLLPYLLDRGVKSLDYVIISHFDFDHIGGILYLMEKIKIKNVIISKQFEVTDNLQKFYSIAQSKKINVQIVQEGDRLNIEKNLFFNILWPQEKNMISENAINNNSIVLDIIYFDSKKEKLNIGEIVSYSFAIITSKNTFDDYKKLDKEKKEKHTFFKMKEHCEKNNFEFYIYDYFTNEIYIYNKNNDNIVKCNDFFDKRNKLEFFDKNLGVYEFINSSKKKLSLKSTNKQILYPFANYYKTKNEQKIHIINLAKYEYNPLMLKKSTGIKDIGIAFWNYKSNNDKQIDNLMINLDEDKKYFIENKIVKNKPKKFENLKSSSIHALLFSIKEEKDNDIFLKKKRKNKQDLPK